MGASFMEVARRRGDFALAGVAAVVSLDQEGRCSEIRLALCGVGETPVDAGRAASSLIGQRCTDKAIETVAADVRGTIAPSGNVHASADYQRHIAGVLTRRAIATAYKRIDHAA
jgi:carbon-monoxide dehydrogenase medium subunit